MDALLWVLLIVVVVGAVWWFRFRATPGYGGQTTDGSRPTPIPPASDDPDPQGRRIEE
ncbi:hypothetical protein [Arthrobacter sp. CAN_A1]|uniref:hypothetical protein n=1 Tax=Arthrobacter sp. CAN_A1 TaxID=2787717 RepID=UPI0018CAD66E